MRFRRQEEQNTTGQYRSDQASKRAGKRFPGRPALRAQSARAAARPLSMAPWM